MQRQRLPDGRPNRVPRAPHLTQAARPCLQAALLGQDSAGHHRFRTKASDWNLGFPPGGREEDDSSRFRY